MKLRSLFLTAMCALAAFSFTACDDDEGPDGGGGSAGGIIENTDPSDRIYILNEGKMNSNNAGIDFYSPVGGEDGSSLFIGDIYMTQNGEGLGDTGQDMICHNDYLYAVASGSCTMVKMNKESKLIKKISFTAEEGQPRYMAAKNGKIYVTLYSGNVIRINAETLEKEGMVKVGSNPEGIVELNGKLYVNNGGWGYDNTMSVIDIATFTEEQKVTVASNPNEILTVGGKIFIQSYGGAYPDYDYQVQEYDPATGVVKRVGDANHHVNNMTAHDGVIYFVYSETDWSTYQTTNSFSTYDVATGVLSQTSYLNNLPAAITGGIIYMLDIDPDNGDFYVSVSDYVSNGTVYRFNKDGNLTDTMESYGLNPKKAVFVD